MRTDYESVMPLCERVEAEVIDYLKKVIPEVDIVAVSDYGKGFLTQKILSTILSAGKNHGIRVVVDPKGKDFSKYNGAFLIKPNNKEAYAAAGCDSGEPLERVAESIFQQVDTDHLLVTRSDKGMALFSKDAKEPSHFSAVKKDVLDVTGAGDTALAMITFGLANNLSFAHTIALANIASGLAIERVGCAVVRLSDVAARLLEREPLSKIFWEDTNLFVLERAVDDAPVVILDLSSHQDITTSTYHLIKEIAAKKGEAKLIAHIPVTAKNKDFIHLLASMHEIDFVYARKDDPTLSIRRAELLTTI